MNQLILLSDLTSACVYVKRDRRFDATALYASTLGKDLPKAVRNQKIR